MKTSGCARACNEDSHRAATSPVPCRGSRVACSNSTTCCGRGYRNFDSRLRPCISAQVDPGRLRLRVGDQALDALVPALARLLVAAERLRHVAVVKTIHPDDPGLHTRDAKVRLAAATSRSISATGPALTSHSGDTVAGLTTVKRPLAAASRNL